MRLRLQHFGLHKAGNEPEEYEDAFSENLVVGRMAMADGASDSYDSRRWAQLLVKAFTTDPSHFKTAELQQWLAIRAQQWVSKIAWEDLPWYKVEKARRGAFSTLLGLQFEFLHQISSTSTLGGKWRALAVGDTCLFQVRDNHLRCSFPIEKSDDFGTTPPLVSTDSSYNRLSLKNLRVAQGDCELGDVFLLATDALAQWVLGAYEEGKNPLASLEQLRTKDEFERFVIELRQKQAIRNDDVTLVVVRVEIEERVDEGTQQEQVTPPRRAGIPQVRDPGPEPILTPKLNPREGGEIRTNRVERVLTVLIIILIIILIIVDAVLLLQLFPGR